MVGVVANFVTDIYEYFLERGLGKNRDWHLVGRWVAYLGRGIFRHNDIDKVLAMRSEFAVGWIFHYLVGVYFAAIYLIILAAPPERFPSLWNALAFGLITVLLPWLILTPGQGGGFFASKTDRPNFNRITSLSAHAVFGIGLYLGALIYTAV